MSNSSQSNTNARWEPTMASPEQQAIRRAHTFALVRDVTREKIVRTDNQVYFPYYDSSGQLNTFDTRVQIWLAWAYLAGAVEDRALGNEILATMDFFHAEHFIGAAAATMLVAHKEQLTPAAVAHLERYLLRYFSDLMTDDFRFHGANDNAPAGCMAALILGGQYFNNSTLVEFARKRLQEFSRMLDLRGFTHECNSPTYSVAFQHDMAPIAEYAADAEIRGMALRIEQRVWQDLLLHFHPRLKHQVGPFSRGYWDDNTVQCSMAMFGLYAAFGEVTPFNPLNMLFPPTPGSFAHNSWDFQYVSLAAVVSQLYHPPVELAVACFNSPELPMTVLGSNEYMGAWGIPGGNTTVNSYCTEEFGLGTFGSRVWAGQTTPLHLLYRRCEVPQGASVREELQGVRSIYTRMNVTDTYASYNDRAKFDQVKELGSDSGAAFTVQQEGTALLGYVPIFGEGSVKTIRTSVVIPMHHSKPDELRFGDQPICGCSASFSTLDWCFLRDGEIYLGVYPLLAKQQHVHLCATQFADCEPYGLISFFSMCDFTATQFSAAELRAFGSGLVFEVGTAKQYGSFENFIATVRKAEIFQLQYVTERTLRYRREGIDLELLYDYAQLNLRRAVSNGQIVSEAVKLETSPALPLVR